MSEPSTRVGWLALAAVMVAAAALMAHASRGLGFVADELFAYARLIDGPDGPIAFPFGVEYLLSPHNGHLQVGGRLLYEGSFAAFGAAYEPFRVLTIAGVLACVAVFYALAVRRVGVIVALAASALLLFMGAAWEVMLWPFDLHTTFALAAGLGALLALDTAPRHGDAIACALLVGSIAMIEVGLSFVVAAAVLVSAGRDRLRRAWIWSVPLVLYACWWLWSQRFDQESELSNPDGALGSLFDSLVGVAAALTGFYGHGADVNASVLDPDGAAVVVAVILLAGIGWALARRRATATTWALLAALLVYWLLIGLADRAEDSSRYVWVGAVLVLLITADLLSGALSSRARLIAALGVLVVAAVAFPAGRAKIDDGRSLQINGQNAVRADLAMHDLLADTAGPYDPEADPLADELEPAALLRLQSHPYVAAARRIEPLGFSLAELRDADLPYRRTADLTAIDLLGIELVPGPPPSARTECRRATTAGSMELPAGGAALRGLDSQPVPVGIGRFSTEAPAEPLGTVSRSSWSALKIPIDRAPDRWRVFANGGVEVCRLPSG